MRKLKLKKIKLAWQVHITSKLPEIGLSGFKVQSVSMKAKL